MHRIEAAGLSAAPTALVVAVLVTHPFRGGLTFGNGPTGLSCVPHFVSVLSEHNRKPAPVFITLGEPQAHQDTAEAVPFVEDGFPRRVNVSPSPVSNRGHPESSEALL
jgi:hypothetical protein